jgi:uncharacterized protein YndB with AHSA1/START domain
MPDILHMIGIKSPSPDATYKTLTTRDGLARWWTETADLDGDVIRFRFGGNNGFDMKVLEADPSGRVRWEVVAGPEEWVGTKIGWQLRQEGDYTMVLFKHEGWREPVEFMHFCSTKWATFLLSLRSVVETGKGAAWPNDVKLHELH